MGERVVTAAELDAMTPTERQEHFEASVVDPGTLTPAQRAAVIARQDQIIARQQQAS
jgi:hypothetical protein